MATLTVTRETNRERERQGRTKLRKSVRNLHTDEVAALREAFAASYARSDDRGFQHFAGLHGLPTPYYCMHNTWFFVAWHRAYLYFFELSLQDLVPGVTLPYWNWSSSSSHQDGIPSTYSVQTVNGNPNPLYSGPIAIENRNTAREHGDPGRLPSAGRVATLLDLTTFRRFGGRNSRTPGSCELIHNGIHNWVSGDMGSVALAAYDPIFWAHHSNVDRLWALWQNAHPNSMPREDEYLDKALAPFNVTVRQMLDTTKLGYEYAAYEAPITGTTAGRPEVRMARVTSSRATSFFPTLERD